MTFDTIIAIGALTTTWVITVVGWIVWAWRMSLKNAAEKASAEIRSKENATAIEKVEATIKAEIEEALKRCQQSEDQNQKLGMELSQFREHVAKSYASVEIMNRMEERIVDALNRLGDRFDAYMQTGRERSGAARSSR
jgi:hypothetical protein